MLAEAADWCADVGYLIPVAGSKEAELLGAVSNAVQSIESRTLKEFIGHLVAEPPLLAAVGCVSSSRAATELRSAMSESKRCLEIAGEDADRRSLDILLAGTIAHAIVRIASARLGQGSIPSGYSTAIRDAEIAGPALLWLDCNDYTAAVAIRLLWGIADRQSCGDTDAVDLVSPYLNWRDKRTAQIIPTGRDAPVTAWF